MYKFFHKKVCNFDMKNNRCFLVVPSNSGRKSTTTITTAHFKWQTKHTTRMLFFHLLFPLSSYTSLLIFCPLIHVFSSWRVTGLVVSGCVVQLWWSIEQGLEVQPWPWRPWCSRCWSAPQLPQRLLLRLTRSAYYVLTMSLDNLWQSKLLLDGSP